MTEYKQKYDNCSKYFLVVYLEVIPVSDQEYYVKDSCGEEN